MSDSRDPQVHTITVHGTGKVELPPDAARIQIAISVSHASAQRAQANAATKMTAVLALVDEAGIAKEDRQTAGYRLFPHRQYDSNKKDYGKILNYTVTNALDVTVRELDRLPALLGGVVEEGTTSVSGPFFFLQHEDQAISLAQERAARNAQAKAAHLANLFARQLGPAIRISEPDEDDDPSAFSRGLARFSLREDHAAIPAIEAGTISIEVRLRVDFEIL